MTKKIIGQKKARNQNKKKDRGQKGFQRKTLQRTELKR